MYPKRVKEIKELFYSYLRQNGLKKTHQKDLILETFLTAEGHMSVEDVYTLVRRRDKKVGVVTVFRTLKSLTDCGIAREIHLGDGLTRFEHSYHHPDHHHIVCTECRKAIEFASPELERVQGKIVEKYRFTPVFRRFQIYGVCGDCEEKRPKATAQACDTEKIFARDALRMALHMEREGIRFYRDLAVRNIDPGGREVLLRVAEAEEEHLNQLQSGLEEMERQDQVLAQAPTFLHYDAGELRKLFPDLHPYEVDGKVLIDERGSLELAMELQKRCAGFFRKYSELFEDTDGKEVLEQFAEKEMLHCRSIGAVSA